MNRSKLALFGAAATLVLALGNAAFGQTVRGAEPAAEPVPSPSKSVSPAAAETAAPTSPELTEIVVTAEHRNENIQNVPIAVTAITGNQITYQLGDIDRYGLRGSLAAFLPVQPARGPFTVDVDGSTAHLANNLVLSDELQLAGKILSDLSYVSGLYFEDERINNHTVARSLDLAPIMDRWLKWSGTSSTRRI